MPTSLLSLPRLYIEDALNTSKTLRLERDQTHYLKNVLRKKEGDKLLLFNGKDGEWLGHILHINKKKTELELLKQSREQSSIPNLTYCFAPLKQARLDYMMQKATEMGVSKLIPVLTQYTQVRKLNEARIKANCIEAAEQCGILSIPILEQSQKLDQLIESLSKKDHPPILIFCDEAETSHAPMPFLKTLIKERQREKNEELFVLIGPEGGFSKQEREMILEYKKSYILSLGSRILRADTAAIAALALIQASLGDWK